MKVMKRTVLSCVAAIAMVAMISRGMVLNVCAEEYVYDDLNRVIRVIYDDGGSVEYVYDSNGNIVRTIVSAVEKETVAESQESVDAEQENSSTDNALNGKKMQGVSKEKQQGTVNVIPESGKEQTVADYKNERPLKENGVTQSEPLNVGEILSQRGTVEEYVRSIVKSITEYAKQTFKQQ